MNDSESPARLLATFIKHIECLDAGGCTDLLAEDAAMLVPFAAEGLPGELHGRTAIISVLEMLPRMFRRMSFTDLRVYGTDDPAVAVAFAHTTATLTDGAAYEQDNVFFARAQEGKIIEYREYMDPVRAGRAIAAIS